MAGIKGIGRLDDPPPRLGIVLGTRPEVIKLYPLLLALAPFVAAGRVVVRLLSTGQQRQLLDQALAYFDIEPDADLDAMNRDQPGENPAQLHGRLVPAIGRWLAAERIDRCVVQGDTSSAFAGALAAFYGAIPVSHIEAGLRTWDNEQPFPEELHRRSIALCADQHFCPTPRALANLRRDGIDMASAWVVGNTVIDAVRLLADRIAPPADLPAAIGPRLFVTVHRRENHARLRGQILPALRRVIADHPKLDAVVSVHPHPAVRGAVQRVLAGTERVWLRAPLDYGESLALVRDATLVVTDSGGLLEEATALGTPTVVLRQSTDRQEAIESGQAILPGTGAVAIAQALHRLLEDDDARRKMAHSSRIFGDGHAAEAIAQHIVSAVSATADFAGASEGVA